MDWYKDWFGTRYYALLYGHRDERDAAPWVTSIVERWQPQPGERLLDLACGRGRHALHFARQGLRVTGVDLSAASIQEARLRVPDAEFMVHDIREPFPGEPFPYVSCLFTSLGYTADVNDDLRILQTAARALSSGGRFVLDLMNPTYVIDRLVPLEEREIDGVRFEVRRWFDTEFIHKEITVLENGHYSTFREQVRMLRPEQVETMVLQCGLVVEDRTDGPVLTPFKTADSQRYVLWTRKPKMS
jgi:SAM-dependent methyltransferase